MGELSQLAGEGFDAIFIDTFAEDYTGQLPQISIPYITDWQWSSVESIL